MSGSAGYAGEGEAEALRVLPSAAQQYQWACETLRVIWILYGVCYAVLLTLASSERVTALRTGWWFGWQLALLPAVLAPRVETVDGGQLMGAVDVAHTCASSAAPYVVKMSPRMAVVYTYARIGVWAAVALGDAAFFLYHLIKCFADNCDALPNSPCCVEGNLYAVALCAALIGTALALCALWVLWRVPRSPTFYLADPLASAAAAADAPLVARRPAPADAFVPHTSNAQQPLNGGASSSSAAMLKQRRSPAPPPPNIAILGSGTDSGIN